MWDPRVTPSELKGTAGESLSTVARIPALDGVRGMAVLLVLLFHLNLIEEATQIHPVDAIVSTILGIGWCGVDLFFVLSGYLITRILYETKGTDGYFRNFYLRRVWRIFPIYYALLLVTFVVLPNLPSAIMAPEKLARWASMDTDPLWFWLYLSNFAFAIAGTWGHGTLDVTWSLAIEEQFYLVWPFAVYKLKREELLKTCLAVFVGAFVLRVLMTLGDVNGVATYVFTPARLDVIAAGAFVALAAADSNGIHRLFAARRIWVVTAVALAGLFFWRGTLNEDPMILTVGLSLMALNFAALLATVLTLPPEHWLIRLYSIRWLRNFGKYSYAIYLVHMPLAAAVRDVFYGPIESLSFLGSRLPGQVLFYIFTTSLIFAVALASWHLCEKRFLRLRPSTVFGTKSPAYASVS